MEKQETKICPICRTEAKTVKMLHVPVWNKETGVYDKILAVRADSVLGILIQKRKNNNG